jgi:3-mercaptopyruvate sulfurtransferase SseA
VARLLIDRGFRKVRPLAGGLDAWIAAGFEVESPPLVMVRDAGNAPEPRFRDPEGG